MKFLRFLKPLTLCLTLLPLALHAQDAGAAKAPIQQPADAKSAAKPTPTDELDEFAPKPAPPLPAGMHGSDATDPRYTLKPGLYDAGELAMGMKHLDFVKKPDPFRLDATSPDDPRDHHRAQDDHV